VTDADSGCHRNAAVASLEVTVNFDTSFLVTRDAGSSGRSLDAEMAINVYFLTKAAKVIKGSMAAMIVPRARVSTITTTMVAKEAPTRAKITAMANLSMAKDRLIRRRQAEYWKFLNYLI
jgi:hypothetical protein